MDVDAIPVQEFRALRDTIRERGTIRMVLVTVACVAWGGLAVAVMLVAPVALLLLLPLVVLATGFEINFALHLGIERVGRYLQVAFEERSAVPGWETASLQFATRFVVRGPDPLLIWIFVAAVAGNYVCVLLTNAEPTDLGVVTLIHLGLLSRFAVARRTVRAQRQDDLARFRELIGERPDN
jgi:hypothetical protein